MRVLTARALGVRRRVGVVAAILTALAVLGTSVPPTEAAGFGARPYGVSQEASAHVEVTASPMWLEVGMSARLTATVIDEEGEPVLGARVLFTESLSVAAVDTRLKTTDENGQAHSAFSAEGGGVFTIVAAVVEILPDGTWGPTLFQDEIELHVAEPEPEPEPEPEFEPEFVPEFEPEFEPEAELEPAAILPAIPALRAGGQFVEWLGEPSFAADVFRTVEIAWLYDPVRVAWTSYIPALNRTNFALRWGAVLWIVSETAQEIRLPGVAESIPPPPPPPRLSVTGLSCDNDLSHRGELIARVLFPIGDGSADIEVIRDGDFPPAGSLELLGMYDTFDGIEPASEDWIGYVFDSSHWWEGLLFQEGLQFDDGGWFETLTVQVRQDGRWVTVTGLTIIPGYPFGDNELSYETFELTFDPLGGTGSGCLGRLAASPISSPWGSSASSATVSVRPNRRRHRHRHRRRRRLSSVAAATIWPAMVRSSRR